MKDVPVITFELFEPHEWCPRERFPESILAFTSGASRQRWMHPLQPDRTRTPTLVLPIPVPTTVVGAQGLRTAKEQNDILCVQ